MYQVNLLPALFLYAVIALFVLWVAAHTIEHESIYKKFSISIFWIIWFVLWMVKVTYKLLKITLIEMWLYFIKPME